MFKAALFVLLLLSAPLYAQNLSQNPPLIIEDIQCRNNFRTSCDFIKAQLLFSAQETLDEDKVANARLRIATLPYISQADIFLEKGSQRNYVILIVHITEAGPYQFEALINASSDSGDFQPELTARIVNNNLFGRGKALGLYGRSSYFAVDDAKLDIQVASIRYIDPNFIGLRRYFFSTNIGRYANKIESEEGDVRRFRQSYINFLIGRRLWENSYFSMGSILVFSRRIDYYDNNNDDVFSVFTDGDIIELNGTDRIILNNHSHHFIGYGWNSENDPHFPTIGSRFNLSFTRLDSDVRNDRWDTRVEFRKHWTTQGGDTWGVLLRPTDNGAIADNPSAFASIESLERHTFLASYSHALPNWNIFPQSIKSRWTIDAGFMDRIRFDESEGFPTIGIGLKVQTERFGIVNFTARYIND